MDIKPLMTRKDVCELIGIEDKALSVYIGRGKIIMNKNKHFDTSIRHNRDWLESMYLKRANKPAEKPKPKIQEEQRQKQAPRNQSEIDYDSDSLAGVELKLKKADVELKNQRIKNLKVQEQKLTGELIPFKDVMKVVPAYVNQYKSRIYQSGENLLLEIMNIAGFSSSDIALYKSRWRNEVNSATTESIEDIKGIVDNITTENSIKDESE